MKNTLRQILQNGIFVIVNGQKKIFIAILSAWQVIVGGFSNIVTIDDFIENVQHASNSDMTLAENSELNCSKVLDSIEKKN